ncbi:MAG: PHP domain-containing protein [Alphaproteobacteria bacterium]|nr:PHP domain-containing protein [Alphaproteobacteria bacterium]
MLLMDLHTHSSFSYDAATLPEELVGKAYDKGVRMLALTDHDNLAGIKYFLKAAKERPDLIAVPGVELSKHDDIEILALGIKNPSAFSRYMDHKNPSMEDMVKHALAMRAIPVLAHPGRLGLSGAKLEKFILQLKGYGLMGLECFHPDNPKAHAAELAVLAKRHGLLATCGSDYHGYLEPNRILGHFGAGDWENCAALAHTFGFIKNWIEK